MEAAETFAGIALPFDDMDFVAGALEEAVANRPVWNLERLAIGAAAEGRDLMQMNTDKNLFCIVALAAKAVAASCMNFACMEPPLQRLFIEMAHLQ